MRSWIPRIAVGLLVVAAILVASLAWLLPRLVETDEFREAIAERAARALGGSPEWTSLELGLFPPRLVLEDPALIRPADAGPVDATRSPLAGPELRADSLDLRLSPLALLSRRVQIDSLVVQGASIRIVRTAAGLLLPVAPGRATGGGESGRAAGGRGDAGRLRGEEAAGVGRDAGRSGANFDLAIERLVLSDSRLVVVDETRSPTSVVALAELGLEATGEGLENPLALTFAARLAAAENAASVLAAPAALDPIGRVRGRGSVDLFTAGAGAVDGTGGPAFDLQIELEDVLLRPLAAYLPVDALGEFGSLSTPEPSVAPGRPPAPSFAGKASGRVSLATGPGRPFAIGAALRVEDWISRLARLDLAGTLELDVETEVPATSPRTPDVTGSGQIPFEVALDLEGGGRIQAKGHVSRAGLAGAVAEVVFDDVDLAIAARRLPEATRIDGRLAGTTTLRWDGSSRLESFGADLEVGGGRLVRGALDLAGSLDLEARQEATRSGAAPIRLSSRIRLEPEGRITLGGTTTRAGVAELEATFDGVPLAPLRGFLPDPEIVVSGRASGTGRLSGELIDPARIELEARVEAGAFETTDYAVKGPFRANAAVDRPLSAPRGTLDLDLTSAEVAYGDQFNKAAGTRAALETRFGPDESGGTEFESRLELRDIDEILLQGSIDPSISLEITSDSIDLERAAPLFPALARLASRGRARLAGFRVERTGAGEASRNEFGGRIELTGVEISLSELGRVRLDGTLQGLGTGIRSQDLMARIAGTTVAFEGTIEDPLGARRFDTKLETRGESDVNDLLSALTTRKDTLLGALEFAGRLEGALVGAETSGGIIEGLSGELRFSVGKKAGGVLRGGSILKAMLDQMPLLRGAEFFSRPLRSGRSVDDYFAERFELLDGDLAISQGRVDARLLRLEYPGYQVRLSGRLGLADLGLDMKGEILLEEELVSALAAASGIDTSSARPVPVELARVTRTLDDPKLSMTSRTLAAVPELVLQTSAVGEIVGEIEDKLERGAERLGRVLRGEGRGSN